MSKKTNNITISDSFQSWAHKWGRIGTLIALIYMIALPFVVLAVYDSIPALSDVINVGTISILMIYIPVGISEALSYTPILGSSSYASKCKNSGQLSDSSTVWFFNPWSFWQ